MWVFLGVWRRGKGNGQNPRIGVLEIRCCCEDSGMGTNLGLGSTS
jgi:hypothetical protein